MCVCVCVESEEEEAEEEQVETHTSPEPAQDSAPYYEPPPVRYVHVQVHTLKSLTCAHTHTRKLNTWFFFARSVETF